LSCVNATLSAAPNRSSLRHCSFPPESRSKTAETLPVFSDFSYAQSPSMRSLFSQTVRSIASSQYNLRKHSYLFVPPAENVFKLSP
jgi:hypothetical protein